jgi:nicotinamidase-related amidase
MDDAPPSAKRGWEVQVGMSLKCLSGEDKGLEARYTTTSAGGKRGVQTLAVAIAEAVDKDQTKPVPVVLLKKEHYQHKSYGRIFTPLFDIQSWVSMDGEEPEIAEEVEAAAPARRRRGA